MKFVKTENPSELPGEMLSETDSFHFRCYPGISCFNLCCRNLNLFLYPYDILRLKKSLGVSTDRIIETHTDVILREGSYFPHVLLKMADNAEKTCPFLTDDGCRVYPDRPQTCRAFPVEQGLYFADENQPPQQVHFFRPPDFCRGQDETTAWTIRSWEADQNALFYNQMTLEWAEVLRLFQTDPWGDEGPDGRKGRMAFMAAYNIDAFRDFVFNSSFLKRYTVKSRLRVKLKSDDVAMLRLGFAWIKLFVFGIKTGEIEERG
ncbi:MAG: YkgJ family cysteine cluster protein [Thermodesulfobacteriota bacterium]